MATKTITIKDAFVPELIEVFGYGWPTEVLDIDGETLIPNPQTKTQFANQRFDALMKDYIHKLVLRFRNREATEALVIDNTEITE